MRITVVFIFLFSGLQALADVAGSMSCVVKSNMVVSISEGVTKKYTGYKDRFKVGDKLIFSYHARPVDPEIPIGGSLSCDLKDKARDEIVNMADHTLGSGNDYEGDSLALRLCMERIAPAPRDNTVHFSFCPP